MAVKALPEAAYLRECFDYDPETGVLTWKHRPREHFPTYHAWNCWNARFPGRDAGSRHSTGYIHICVDDVRYKAHRVIWMLQTGTDPLAQIDHQNQDRTDNRWANLRAATNQQNTLNRRSRKRYEEYPWPRNVWKDGSKFRSYLQLDGRRVHLGMFNTAEEAHAAWKAASELHHGDFSPSGPHNALDSEEP